MKNALSQSRQATRPDIASIHFFGIVRSEWLKVCRMRQIRMLFFLLLVVVSLPDIILLAFGNIQAAFGSPHAALLSATSGLAVVRASLGFFLLIVTAYVYGHEYQYGTIRIVLARGVGRLQLLFGKLLAVAGVALVVLGLCLLLSFLWLAVILAVRVGSFDTLSTLAWPSIGLYILTILTSMGATMLVAVTFTSLGRSLPFALSASLLWFPVDNFLPLLCQLGYMLTHQSLWLNLTQYQLGPVLNYMPVGWLGDTVFPIGTTPYAAAVVQGKSVAQIATLSHVHVWLVIGVYSVIFLVSSMLLTAKREVRE
ncbi:hypothetical protein EPA93_14655 [Ktedonosporobacter rubrisoli]|uniref:Uncharacterized protein n=1 Tax=Ktedonosporobacter rubrisoli TaxID=2509675 RepID=A0A4V0YYR8_KTERU|nr:ABC transporter permease [Ktedonosporobacter rubrisoli]QBD77171.1 hypothetical protein EPA93_14655 [Ktedonosporobacter rubrisoli]